MKKYSLLLLIIFSAFFSHGQADCMSANFYDKITPNSEKRINEPFVICFNDYYVTYASPSLGGEIFKIDKVYNDLKGGYLTKSFMSEEDATHVRGYIYIQIDYGKTKTATISFTMFGYAYTMESKGVIPGAKIMNGKDERMKSQLKIIAARKDTTPFRKTLK